MQIKRMRFVLGVAAVLGVASGVSVRQAEANSASTVYLWRDSKGACPAACDNNDYSCPCKTTTEME